MIKRVSCFRELRNYAAACELNLAVFLASKHFPKEEVYSLTDPVRRFSRSSGANPAEAWAKRRYPAHSVSKLTDADGELPETRHWLGRALAYGYLAKTDFDNLEKRGAAVGGMLGQMMRDPDSFRTD